MNKIIKFILFFLTLILLVFIVNIFSNNNDKSKDIKTATDFKKDQYIMFIDVGKKQLSLIDNKNHGLINSFTIATGKISSPTPLGNFNIISKASWGEGFGSRWIGLDVSWGNYGIHGTNKPGSIGYNSSAGCIRMKNRDIEELFDLIDYDTTVIISNGEFGPFGNGFRELRPGDRGADVLEVQKRLNQKGDFKLSLDGIYGEDMKKSLISFLKTEKLELTDKITGDIYEMLGIILMD